jgi:hypothetical protein
MAAMILLGLAFRLPPSPAVGLSLNAQLMTEGAASQSRFDDGDQAATASGAAATLVATATSARPTPTPTPKTVEELLSQVRAPDPTKALPQTETALNSSALEGGGVGQARGAAQTPGAGAGRGSGAYGAGRARTSIFGVPGEGYKFAYVFDRSGSTGGPRNTLAAAKAQLIASLDNLDSVHQFLIIFYNERPLVFSPTGQAGRLVFATEQNKELARRFILSITPDGGTRHDEALMLALKMQPDVIFFLTDGDDPKLLPHQLDKIRRYAGGIQINAVEFGVGPPSKDESFMVQLARDNAGKYGYVDVTRLETLPAAPQRD